MSLQYNPKNCTQCGVCVTVCPLGEGVIPSVSPLQILPNCIGCDTCIASCPEGEKVLVSHLDYLLPNFVSVFGDLKPKNEQTTPPNPSENPNPNKDAESSQDKGESSEGNTQTSTGDSSDKDNKGEGQKSEGESSTGKSEQDSSKNEGILARVTQNLATKTNKILYCPPPNTNYKQHKNFARNNDTTKLLSHDKITRAFLVA